MARRAAAAESSAASEHLRAVLLAARAEAGLSQQRLAQNANVSIGSVTKIEAGRSPEPGFFVIAQISRALRDALPAHARDGFEHELQKILLQPDPE